MGNSYDDKRVYDMRTITSGPRTYYRSERADNGEISEIRVEPDRKGNARMAVTTHTPDGTATLREALGQAGIEYSDAPSVPIAHDLAMTPPHKATRIEKAEDMGKTLKTLQDAGFLGEGSAETIRSDMPRALQSATQSFLGRTGG